MNIWRTRELKRATIVLCLAFLIFSGPLVAQKKSVQRRHTKPASAIPTSFSFSGWLSSEKTVRYLKDRIPSYPDEFIGIALPYGILDISVFRFKPVRRIKTAPGKEFKLEIFRMESAQGAYGLFTAERNPDDGRSGTLPIPHWIRGAAIGFVKGNAYVRIIGSEYDKSELEKIAVASARKMTLPSSPIPVPISWLPQTGMVPQSERLIKGRQAAVRESPLLDREFWGFQKAKSFAIVGHYAPADSKLIIVVFDQPPGELAEPVTALFNDYLEAVKSEEDSVQAMDAGGACFLFAQKERVAGIILGEPDLETARARLKEALERAGAPIPGQKP
jgi:hypothetical protein